MVFWSERTILGGRADAPCASLEQIQVSRFMKPDPSFSKRERKKKGLHLNVRWSSQFTVVAARGPIDHASCLSSAPPGTSSHPRYLPFTFASLQTLMPNWTVLSHSSHLLKTIPAFRCLLYTKTKYLDTYGKLQLPSAHHPSRHSQLLLNLDIQ